MEKKAAEPIPISTQKSLSSSHDSGWNDPPKWAYSQSPNSVTTPTKRVLNKRVAFPLGSTPPTCNFDPNLPLTPPPANMPPPPLTKVTFNSLPNPVTGDSDKSEETVTINKEQAMIDSMENFENIIQENEELVSKGEDIRRRLNIMKTAWIEDKLDENIHRKVLEISNALRKNDAESADKIHVSLMMDSATLCSSWISGIRHMILATRSKQVQEKPLIDGIQSPYLLPCTDVRKTD